MFEIRLGRCVLPVLISWAVSSLVAPTHRHVMAAVGELRWPSRAWPARLPCTLLWSTRFCGEQPRPL